MINRDRLAATFKTLAEIDSTSKSENAVASEIVKITSEIGAETYIDDSASVTGSDTGNHIIKYKGNIKTEPILLSAHLDTVEPGKGIKAILKDGVFTSDGTTILGADDKSAIAIILETLSVVHENNLPCGPIELVLTTCEEIGLVGAKNLDFSLINAKYGYVLDTADTEGIVIQAPAANQLEYNIYGKDAHAGAFPEEGINAITLVSKAIAGLTIGRIDHETTCNIGIINGGVATNIVPGFVSVKGEARSHNLEKLNKVTEEITSSFRNVIESYIRTYPGNGVPRLEVNIKNDFPFTNIPVDHLIVKIAQKAAANLNKQMFCQQSGGGSDANIFFSKGIITGVLGTGMKDMHSVRESIRLDDMITMVELLLEILKLHSLERNI
ncbi:MAG: M20/M25/M40 family metallo-hydrolase [Desulfobacterales bacterium]|nr:M20/M25/M40 family metallo-hydrolase [Desulfobacterales bacterium]